jgi:hypothetical protein
MLPRLVKSGGAVVVRVPNKLTLIRARQLLSRVMNSRGSQGEQDHLAGFNPEHIYVLSRRYLTKRLANIGFASVRVVPSPPLLASSARSAPSVARLMFRAAQAAHLLSLGALVLTPSMLIIGEKLAARSTPNG